MPAEGRRNVTVGMARPEGIEPPAYRFEACRSIHLSYGRTIADAYVVSGFSRTVSLSVADRSTGGKAPAGASMPAPTEKAPAPACSATVHARR